MRDKVVCVWPFSAAQCSGVWPSSSAALTSDPFSMSAKDISLFPFFVATCRGVNPFSSGEFTFIPSARSCNRAFMFPFRLASCIFMLFLIIKIIFSVIAVKSYFLHYVIIFIISINVFISSALTNVMIFRVMYLSDLFAV